MEEVIKMEKLTRHECETLQKSDVPITVECHNETWLWCFWGKGPGEGHGIRFCPYCGKNLYEHN